MYVVKNGDAISSFLYVGTTGGNGLDRRFGYHYQNSLFFYNQKRNLFFNLDTFNNQTNLQRAILFKGLSRDSAELIEALLILASKINNEKKPKCKTPQQKVRVSKSTTT